MGDNFCPAPSGRVSANYAVTREQKRAIAKVNMKKAGNVKFCKHSYYSVKDKNGMFSSTYKEPSYFSQHWREFLEVK